MFFVRSGAYRCTGTGSDVVIRSKMPPQNTGARSLTGLCPPRESGFEHPWMDGADGKVTHPVYEPDSAPVSRHCRPGQLGKHLCTVPDDAGDSRTRSGRFASGASCALDQGFVVPATTSFDIARISPYQRLPGRVPSDPITDQDMHMC